MLKFVCEPHWEKIEKKENVSFEEILFACDEHKQLLIAKFLNIHILHCNGSGYDRSGDLKCLIFDLDSVDPFRLHEDKGSEAARVHGGEAFENSIVDEFRSKFNEEPHAVVRTPGGYHVYYLLEESLSDSDINLYKVGYSRLCEEILDALFPDNITRLYKFDQGVFSINRRMRMPNSGYSKTLQIKKEKKVIKSKQVDGICETVYINEIAAAVSQEQLRTLLGSNLSGPTLEKGLMESKSPKVLLPNKTKSKFGQHKPDLEETVGGCLFMNRIYSQQGATSRDDWVKAIGVAAFIDESACHSISSGHDEYDSTEVNKMYSKASLNSGPTSCRKIAAPECSRCEWASKVTNPLNASLYYLNSLRKPVRSSERVYKKVSGEIKDVAAKEITEANESSTKIFKNAGKAIPDEEYFLTQVTDYSQMNSFDMDVLRTLIKPKQGFADSRISKFYVGYARWCGYRIRPDGNKGRDIILFDAVLLNFLEKYPIIVDANGCRYCYEIKTKGVWSLIEKETFDLSSQARRECGVNFSQNIKDFSALDKYLKLEKSFFYNLPNPLNHYSSASRVAFKDVAVDFEDFLSGEAEAPVVRKHSRKDFFTYRIEQDYGAYSEDAPPVFKDFAESFLDTSRVFEDGNSAYDLVLEFMAYTCFGKDNKLGKAIHLQGESSSGKDTLVRLLRKIIGEENCSALRFSKDEGKSVKHKAVTSRLCYAGDVSLNEPLNSAMFNQMVDKDGFVNAGLLYSNVVNHSFKGVVWITSNEDIKFSQSNFQSRIKRLVKVMCYRTYDGAEDMFLGDKLLGEVGLIINEMIRAYRRLHQNKYKLSQSNIDDKQVAVAIEQGEATKDKEKEVDFINTFFEVTANPDDFIRTADIYSIYKVWCESNGALYSIKTHNSLSRILCSIRLSGAYSISNSLGRSLRKDIGKKSSDVKRFGDKVHRGFRYIAFKDEAYELYKSDPFYDTYISHYSEAIYNRKKENLGVVGEDGVTVNGMVVREL